jgi:hypothetical protein
MATMRRQIMVAVSWAVLGSMASSPLATAQQKNAGACLEEWRLNQATNAANGVTKRTFVARCRVGAAAPATSGDFAAVASHAVRDRQAYASIKDLMDAIIDPSADVLWGAVGTVVDEEGEHESIPKTPEAWLDLRRAAIRIVEGANLLMMPGRDAAPVGTKSEVPGVELEPAQIAALIKKNRKSFDAYARSLRVIGLQALRATETKNAESLIEIGGRMQDLCESCHRKFWYP